MTTGDFRNRLEDIRNQMKKVTIHLLHGGFKIGYISEIQEDYISMRKKQDSEDITYIIPLGSISVIFIHN